jgi:hypothetical protein
MSIAAAPGSMSRLIKPFIAPDVFDFWAAKLNPAWAWQRSLARVVERRVEARDAVTLILRPNRNFGGFRPGQHVNVSVEIDGSRVTRSYSLTDIPRRDRRVAITVKRIEGGLFSNHLCTQIGAALDPARDYTVAGWASVNETTEGPPIWEVVETHLANVGTVHLEPNRAVRITGA